jgi:hypothetical protein
MLELRRSSREEESTDLRIDLMKSPDRGFLAFFFAKTERSALSMTHLISLSSRGSLNLLRKGTKLWTHFKAFQATKIAPLVPKLSFTKEM